MTTDDRQDLELGSVGARLERHPVDPPTPGCVAAWRQAIRAEVHRLHWQSRVRSALSAVAASAALIALAFVSWRPTPDGQAAIEGDLSAQTFVQAFEFGRLIQEADTTPMTTIASDLETLESRSASREAAAEGQPVVRTWLLDIDEMLGESNGPENML